MTSCTRSARNHMRDELSKYLVGPRESSEILQELPVDFYHVGILYPKDSAVSAEEIDLADAANMRGEECSDDADVFDLANSKSQSAMGMTFFVMPEVSELSVKVAWGEYTKIEEDTEKSDSNQWQRTSNAKEVNLNVECNTTLSFGRLTLFSRVHNVDGLKSITLSLVNSCTSNGKNRVTEAAFQVSMVVTHPNDVFQPLPPSDSRKSDDEYAVHELLYRKQLCYAVGHGVAVHWDRQKVNRISTTWLPEVEVSKASPDVLSGAQCLDMEWLGSTSDIGVVAAALSELAEAYKSWIEQQELLLTAGLEGEIADRRTLLTEAGQKNLAVARQQLSRIIKGIKWLRSNPDGFRAFQLANKTIATALKWRFGSKQKAFKPQWRAFQLGFILSSMQGAAEHHHQDRDIVDLIWFPTGGGKTEAYLGLSALVLFHRMLIAETPAQMCGVSVLTRYTLRLLTLQQFERTASMICAANAVKDDINDYSDWPDFTLGLFVGSAATPNSLVDAEKIRANSANAATDCTTLPLTRCPVCQTELSAENQEVDKVNQKLLTFCSKETCEANREDGIPIAVVDEHIYAHPPSVVIGTVDKFALMTWKPEIKRLFGQGMTCLPPDLIIQDELHLIGDALGTMVALYETAIDELASRDGQPIKIVGSTATIRRAAQQVRKIYNRDVLQFPAGGIDADDSFFYQRDKKNPGRTYIGVMAQGRSPKHTMIWLAGVLSQASTELPDDVRDAFHSLLVYFNSLRELGGTLVLMEDEVKKYINSIAEDDNSQRSLAQIRELTSRLRAEELRQLLQEMDIPWKPASANVESEAVDVLLSTNMISVGVDIDRLGMMVVNGQPKTTAEYIQATSRVGRPAGAAGLVVTLYNWSRPRDRSHYERFQDYHQSFYRHVESTSVTPFAARARDRALHAIIVALFRCMATSMDVSDPRVVSSHEGESLINKIYDIILARVDSIYRDEPNFKGFREHIESHMQEIREAWEKRVLSVESNWGHMNHRGKLGLLVSPAFQDLDTDDPAADMTWRTPTSMREVEQPVNIKLLKTRSQQDAY